jgi:hypothetical protein
MNVHGRDVLMAAAVEGVRQLRWAPIDDNGGLSAMASLLQARGCGHLRKPSEWFDRHANRRTHHGCWATVYEAYDMSQDEAQQINIENDLYRYDFLTIAWLHCPPADTRSRPSPAVRQATETRAVEVPASEIQILREAQRRRRSDSLAIFSINSALQIWPYTSYGPAGHRTMIRGTLPSIERIAAQILTIRPEGGRCFLREDGVYIKDASGRRKLLIGIKIT